MFPRECYHATGEDAAWHSTAPHDLVHPVQAFRAFADLTQAILRVGQL